MSINSARRRHARLRNLQPAGQPEPTAVEEKPAGLVEMAKAALKRNKEADSGSNEG